MLSARNIRDRRIHFDEYRLISPEAYALEDARTQVRFGDVLLTIVGAIGRAAAVPAESEPFTLQRSVAVLRPAAVNSRFLAYAIEAPRIQKFLEENARGTAQKGVYLGTLGSMVLDVPPENEQVRIADKLDAVLARVDACRERLAKLEPLLKRFRQSVLAAATSGTLTKDWRNRGAQSWPTSSVESLCTSISDGPFGSHLKSDDYVEHGVRVVRLENIGHLSFDSSKETYISTDKYAGLRRHTLVEGDLLFSSFVDEEVRVCEFPADLPTSAINKADCFCLRVDPEKCDRRYLLLRLACKTTYDRLKEVVHGATRPRINLGQLRKFSVAMPPRDEQAEIVRRVGSLFTFADRLEARLAQATAATDRLTPSLLAKAFRGELVPQDPADEPAAELLRRLVLKEPVKAMRRPRSA